MGIGRDCFCWVRFDLQSTLLGKGPEAKRALLKVSSADFLSQALARTVLDDPMAGRSVIPEIKSFEI